ncbi:apolipoprotein N-acyltransferase [Ideonella sp.]|uniref:apolipoprotein N-acyltransferase n=1 Tax=Ideonella sp. TaxID=1929293 RepID=UPI0035B120FD
MYARSGAKAIPAPIAGALPRAAWLDHKALVLLSCSLACGGTIGIGAALPGAWPLSALALSAWAWLVVLGTRRHPGLGGLVTCAGWLAWHVAGQGWVTAAVRDGEHALAWRAAVLAILLVFQLLPLLLAWTLLSPLTRTQRRGEGAIVLRWGLAVACAESLRQLGWWGSGYAHLGVVFVDVPAAGAWVPAIGGAGLGMLVLAVAGLWALAAWRLAAQGPRGARFPGALALAGVLAMVLWPSAPTPADATQGAPLTVTAVQPPAERGRHWTRAALDEALQQLETAIRTAPQASIVVTAETFFPEPPPREPAGTRWGDLVGLAKQRGVHLLVGMPHLLRDAEGVHLANAVVQVSPERRSLYAKERLVPGGEYLPWPSVLGSLYARLFERVREGQRSGPPELTAPLFVGGSTAGVSICHELGFPLIQAARADGAGWLVNLADDGWIDTSLYRRQMVSLARLRAQETGKPLLRVSQGGPTLLVGPDGRVLAQATGHRQAQNLAVTVTASASSTPYLQHAQALALLPLVLAAGAVLLAGRRTAATPSGEGPSPP